MKRRSKFFDRLFLSLAACVVLALLGYYVVIPNLRAWAYARTLAEALKDARSVTLVEYERGYPSMRDIVFARVTASAQQVADLRSATGGWWAPVPWRSSKCFMPHHRVEIVRADGSPLHFTVCFICKNFRLGESGTMMPASWRERLTQFFTSVGMAPGKNYGTLAMEQEIETIEREEERQMEELR